MDKTPKEKAEELVEKFKNYSWTSCVDGFELSSNIESAKQCAIIAVDEFISEYRGYRVKFYLTLEHALNLAEYWEDVKKEIENIKK